MVAKKRKRRGGACKNKINGESCTGKYLLSYDGTAPIFTCEVCGHQELTWKKFYAEYLSLYKTKSNWDDKKNYVSCILGFFLHMYKDFYGEDYVFVPRSPNPFSSKECKEVWALLSAFGGNAHRARKYIYWVFKKAINKNTNIVSFNYLNSPGLIRKYLLKAKRAGVMSRESKLPDEFIDWCKVHIPEIFNKYELGTMNDLGSLLSYLQHYKDEMSEESVESTAISKAESMRLIRDGKINIGGDLNA